jgi:hypothetical protein
LWLGVEALELQPPFNGIEKLESMHLLASAGELDFNLTFVAPEVNQNHLSCFGAIRHFLCLVCRKTKQINFVIVTAARKKIINISIIS